VDVSLFLPFQLLCKDTTILRNFQTILAKKIPQKPVHFFSASDKERDTNNMHLQRHADEGRGRYETYPPSTPSVESKELGLQNPTTGKACRALPKLLTMGYFESTSSTLQNAGDYMLI
jgi:hypothetical protein